MRLLWPLLLVAFGTLVLVHAVGLSERFDAWMSRLRGESSQVSSPPVEKTTMLRVRIVKAVLRVVGIYVILAGVVGMFGILISK
jgi:nitrate reductase NapE component